MLAHLAAALLQLPAQPPAPASPPQLPPATPATAAKGDTNTTSDTSAAARRRRRREERGPKRDSVTAQHLATAYHGSARAILALARTARMHQDSALRSYDATTYQRISAGFGFGRIGRDRLAFRSETATHVQWRRGIGAYIDVTGARAVVPIAGKEAHVDVANYVSPVPYYPGSETLWIGMSAAKASVDENQGIVHPLAEGAEAYYTYESGDSMSFTLPSGKVVTLRELKVRPRSPKWNLAVGSLWFDMSGGQLVRAAYRMAVPMDIGEVAKEDDSTSFDDVPLVLRPLMFPMKAQMTGLGVEYGLYEGRFWLPRLQVIKGDATMGVMHSPMELQQRYEYSQVNAGAPLPPIPPPDSTRSSRVSGSVEIGSDAKMDSTREARRQARRGECDATGNRSYTRRWRDTLNRVRVIIPCDSAKLANSPDLPPSIYDKGEEVVSAAETEALMAQALSMGAQAGFAPQPPVVGVDFPRYNRIEGLSFGGHADQQLGNGYSVHATARIGVADREPNVEVGVARSDLVRSLSLTAYNRLVPASEWGNPLGLGASLRSFLFGQDDGFYYRASGIELGSTPDDPVGSSMTYGLFVEQQRTARQRTTFSLARAMRGTQFEPNIEAARGTYAGARARLIGSFGEDVQGFRLFSDARLEAARGDTGSFGRAALDVTASHGIGNGAVALTFGAGSSVGVMPLQRYWFLGGAQTVRGQAPGVALGNAYWLGRAEVARGVGVVRPVLFGDVGWAGDRTKWRDIGRPISGAGIGATIADGLVRVDLSRGINPSKGWRVDTYLEARF